MRASEDEVAQRGNQWLWSTSGATRGGCGSESMDTISVARLARPEKPKQLPFSKGCWTSMRPKPVAISRDTVTSMPSKKFFRKLPSSQRREPAISPAPELARRCSALSIWMRLIAAPSRSSSQPGSEAVLRIRRSDVIWLSKFTLHLGSPVGMAGHKSGHNVQQAVAQRGSPRTRFLTSPEFEHLLATASENLRPALILAVETGLRREELFGLTTADIDLGKREIHLEQTKTNSPRRVPMSDTAMVTVRDLLRAPRRPRSPYLLCKPDGSRYGDMRAAFASACRRAKMAGFPLARPAPHIRIMVRPGWW